MGLFLYRCFCLPSLIKLVSLNRCLTARLCWATRQADPLSISCWGWRLSVSSHHLVTPPWVASTTRVHSTHTHTRTPISIVKRIGESQRHFCLYENASVWVWAAIPKCISREKRSRAELKLNCRMASRLWIISALRAAAGWSDSSLFKRRRKKDSALKCFCSFGGFDAESQPFCFRAGGGRAVFSLVIHERIIFWRPPPSMQSSICWDLHLDVASVWRWTRSSRPPPRRPLGSDKGNWDTCISMLSTSRATKEKL